MFDLATINYYETNADAYAAETFGATMGSSLARFASILPKEAKVLDWGCGSGRDTKKLVEMGYSVIATDASPAMCSISDKQSNAEVRCESFLDLAEVEEYDGIWACASLLHLRRHQLLDALARANRALVPSGVLYASFKKGNYEGRRDGRWYTDLCQEDLIWLLDSQWILQDVWDSVDVREERSGERWLNFLARKAC